MIALANSQTEILVGVSVAARSEIQAFAKAIVDVDAY
jgi:hypothetical protein